MTKKHFFRKSAFVFVCIWAGFVVPVMSASFNCSKASTPIEKAICNEPRLNEIDTQLGKAYLKLSKSLPKSQAQKLKKEQVNWLKQRLVVCSVDNIDCMISIYEARINALEEQLENQQDNIKSCYDTAQDQISYNICAEKEFKATDKELNQVYQALRKTETDPLFLDKLKKSQLAWIKFRDAEMEAIFPHHEELGYYGSMSPMNWSQQMAHLTRIRAKQLKNWMECLKQDGCTVVEY